MGSSGSGSFLSGALPITLGRVTYWEDLGNERVTDFTTLTQEHLNHILDRLKNRPRKKLGFRTPREALEQALVALQL
jgi:hypothetical protein